MKPFFVLLITCLLSLVIIKLWMGVYDVALAAVIAMAVMLLFTSIAHFAFAKGMELMMPAFIPFRKQLVYATGFIEIAAAAGLLIPATRVITGWFLIIFFTLLLPANINAAIRHIDYQKGTFDGKGTNYLWFRIPLQVLFILWVYFAAVRW